MIAAVVAVGFALGPTGSSGAASATSRDTITFAEGAGASPNSIFPFGVDCTVANVTQFQELMFRPLYWFGLGDSVAYVPALSLADSPEFSDGDKTVTITMKGWKFADGQTVDAQSVMFFLNLYKADPSSYCGYSPGYGIPDQVKNAFVDDDSVVIDFTTSVNPDWILYNYLSEITPLPDSWDRTSASATSACATSLYGTAHAGSACRAVGKYLAAQSAKESTFTDSMWQSGVDGPWRLTSFDDLGDATFKPNRSYSGPQRAQVAEVQELAYTSTQAEEDDLEAGKLDVGYVDPGVLTAPAPTPGSVGPNWGPLKGRYQLVTGPLWGFNYAPFNFSAADPKSAAVRQLYVRQALQLAVDQLGVIKNVDKGYGYPTYSPLPPNPPASLSAPVANPYPFDLAKARALLSAHGWRIENGVQTCTDPGSGPGQCGAGITRGYTLNFSIVWASGTPALDLAFNAEIADWASIGVRFAHSTGTFNDVIKECSGAAQLCSWGGGWTYSPDYYPSGEGLFAPRGGFNVGNYVDARMTRLIRATTFGTADLSAYATYAARQLPVLYEPQAVSPIEVAKSLKSTIGLGFNPLENFMPEYLHY